MARKLKAFQTSMGFFDLAAAAPSMKAALDAWGSKTNLFHQNLARETDEPAVVAATMSHPSVVLKRPVGTTGAFKIEAELPSRLPGKKASSKRTKPAKVSSSAKRHAKLGKAAAAANEREERKREQAERKRQADRKRRDAASAKVRDEIDRAERRHRKRVADINAKRETIDQQSKAENSRWDKERERFEAELRRARK